MCLVSLKIHNEDDTPKEGLSGYALTLVLAFTYIFIKQLFKEFLLQILILLHSCNLSPLFRNALLIRCGASYVSHSTIF